MLNGMLFSPSELATMVNTLLTPDEMYHRVEDLDLEDFYNEGFRTIFLDVDNTLMTYDQRKCAISKISWVEQQKRRGFNVFLVSNNSSKSRIGKVCDQLNCDGVYLALKPLTFGIRDLAKRHKVDLTRSIVIGDQVLKDVMVGNWLKCITILVEPMNKRLSFFKTVQRDIELFILRKLEAFSNAR
jgi:hypothetical protein